MLSFYFECFSKIQTATSTVCMSYGILIAISFNWYSVYCMLSLDL